MYEQLFIDLKRILVAADNSLQGVQNRGEKKYATRKDLAEADEVREEIRVALEAFAKMGLGEE